MGRVCDTHQQFYETECRWCEPSVLADFANAAYVPAHAGQYSAADLVPMFEPPHAWSPTADLCLICHKTGQELWQTREGCAR